MSMGNIMSKRFIAEIGMESFNKPEDQTITVDVGKLRPGCDEYAIIKGILKTPNRKRQLSKINRRQKGERELPKPNKHCERKNENVKKQKKRRSKISPKEQELQFPIQVPTRFAFNLNKPVDVRDHDFVCHYLSIQTNMGVCCVCFQANAMDSMQPIITGAGCNDFGRIFSIVLNLSESDIISPYCCTQCSDKVLDCFNALLELNLAVCCSLRIHRLDPIRDKCAPYLCQLCQCQMNSQQQLMDHVMLHAVEPLPAHDLMEIEQGTNTNRTPVKISVSENIEEGELVPLSLSGGNKSAAPAVTSKSPLLLDVDVEHCYSARSSGATGGASQDEHGQESSLCHICGEMKGSKVLTRHVSGHLNNYTISPRRNRCHICKTITIDRLSMHKHLREAHNIDDKLPKKLKKCRLCDLVFGSARTRNNHEQKEHVVEGYFLCPLCPKKFQFYDSILGHCRLMHPLVLTQTKKIPKKRKRKPRKKVEDTNFVTICSDGGDVTINDYLLKEMGPEQGHFDNGKSGIAQQLHKEPDVGTQVEQATAAQYIVDFINGESYYEELVSTF